MIRGWLGGLLSDPDDRATDRPQRPVDHDGVHRRVVERYPCAEHDATLMLVPLCPACGVDRPLHQPVVEHRQCGSIRPLAAFRAGRGFDCPACGRDSVEASSLAVVAQLDTCQVCETNFDAPEYRLRQATGDDDGARDAMTFARRTSTDAATRRPTWRGADISFDRQRPLAVEP